MIAGPTSLHMECAPFACAGMRICRNKFQVHITWNGDVHTLQVERMVCADAHGLRNLVQAFGATSLPMCWWHCT
jgi:hypothetical protein